ncbi:MAG TPA: carboxypeptidase regulatory-like domain-containing protein [Beijerinckiaceae bacterium]|jgi:streptogramin lyase|nr:carboxypeptidase regulatory-like domain-containing protein [Beijerinckiaceae bacterium]
MIKKPFAWSLIGLAGVSALTLATTAVAQTPAAALSGKVTSQAEGAMEGVVVSAKREGGTITVSVVSDAQGEYHFPAGKLDPGKYDVTIRAIGYDLPAPASVDVGAQSPAHLDLDLTKTAHLSNQLTNAEWLVSMPGTPQQKDQLAGGCGECHTLQRLVNSTHDAAEMAKVVQRMHAHTTNAAPMHPFFLQTAAKTMEDQPAKAEQDLGAFIATINLSTSDAWNYPLKTFPRPKGKATQVIFTTYDLPRADAAPHDEERDAQGNVWISDFQSAILSRLDPKTGKVTEYPIPILKPVDKGFPTGGLQIAIDKDGNVWEGTMGQAQAVRFNPKTEKFDVFPAPDAQIGDTRVTMIDPSFEQVDGKVWVNEAGVAPGNTNFQLDPKTGQWTRVTLPPGAPPAYAYDIVANQQNDAYGMGMTNDNIWKTDAKTLATSYYQIPTKGAGGRRGHIDSQNRLWWAEFFGNGLAMFDPTDQKITEWKIPTPFVNPYDAQFDDKTYMWAGGMASDLVERLNTKTGEFTEYLLPHETNIRHVDVQKSDGLSSLWVEDQHNGKIIHIEPLSP